MKKFFLNTSRVLLPLLFFLTISTSIHAQLPPGAQAALDKGIIAAKLPDYPLAIKYFNDARKLAPDAPIIYFNLGLAESKIPGRELRGIAWFEAYLAAYPSTPNAAAVNEQVTVLTVKNQSNIVKLIRSLEDAAKQLNGYQKIDALQRVAVLWVKANDISAALSTADLCEDNEEGKSYAYYLVSDTQAKSGDIAGAQKTADMIFQQSPNMSRVRTYITYAHSAIAEAQARAGNLSGAQRTFDFALRTAELIPALERHNALGAVVKSQAAIGDIAAAQKTLNLMADGPYKSIAQLSIDKSARSLTGAATESQAGVRPPVKTSDWIFSLDDTHESDLLTGRAPLSCLLLLDLPSYLRSLKDWKSPGESMSYAAMLEKVPVDKKMFDALYDTVEKLIVADQAVTRMRDQQTRQPLKP